MLQNKKWTDFVIWMENEVSIVLKDPLPCFFPSFCQWLPIWASFPFISFEFYELVECSLQFMEFGNTNPCFVALDNKHSFPSRDFPLPFNLFIFSYYLDKLDSHPTFIGPSLPWIMNWM
jgi:hypothetical protein